MQSWFPLFQVRLAFLLTMFFFFHEASMLELVLHVVC